MASKSSNVPGFIKDVSEPSQQLMSLLTSLEEHMEPFLSHPSISEHVDALPVPDQCKLALMRSQVATQLYLVYCRINSLPVESHDIGPELQRLQIYDAKLESLLRNSSSSSSSSVDTESEQLLEQLVPVADSSLSKRGRSDAAKPKRSIPEKKSLRS